MSDAGDKYGGIRSMPNSQKFRDNFDRIFKKKYACGMDADKCPGDCQEIRELGLKQGDYEFCPYCGAGIGEHFREGEGTCEHCDPPDADGRTRGYQGGIHEKKT